MGRKILSIAEVHPSNQRRVRWTALVQVLQSSYPQQLSGGKAKQIRRIVLTNSKGTKVSAAIFDNDIRYFNNLLLPCKRYHISNVVVLVANPNYRLGSYNYYWIITSSTLVEPLQEEEPPTIPFEIPTTKFTELYKYVDSDMLQNVEALVIHAFPPRSQGLNETLSRDFVLITPEKKPMILTLWNDFEHHEGNTIADNIGRVPTLLAMRVKVTTFNALSLTSRPQSAFILNAPTQTQHDLREWYMNNREEVTKLLDQAAYKNVDALLPKPNQDDIHTIQAAMDLFNKYKAAWIKATATLAPLQASFWHTTCNNCTKIINGEVGQKTRCISCHQEIELIGRCKVILSLSDGTTTITASIFGQDAEKLINFNTDQLKKAEDEDIDMTEEIKASLEHYTIVCFLRQYESNYQGTKSPRYSIVKVYIDSEMNDKHPLPTKKTLKMPYEEKMEDSSSSSGTSENGDEDEMGKNQNPTKKLQIGK